MDNLTPQVLSFDAYYQEAVVEKCEEQYRVRKCKIFFSKVFKITDCDEFTVNFLRKLGVKVGRTENQPDDPYMKHRKAVIPPNSGRDAVPMFLRRGPVPKNLESLKLPGVITDRTVLNVFGPSGHGGRYILDSLKTGAISTEFYKDSDLTLGSVLNVWGHKIVLCDCDEFTKEYYQKKYGITEFTSLKFKDDPSVPVPKQVPPYNEEDSLCSCKGLLPKPPMWDFIKFMENDRRGLDSNVLRFQARLDTQKPIDKDRRFIISFFLSDDTIVIFEPPVRNFGSIGGKFMERGRIKKPNQPQFLVEMSEYYKAHDLYVDACVDFNKFKFILLDADEFAFQYMEEHPDEFPMSNVQVILAKVRARLSEKRDDILAIFRENDSTGQGVISYAQFHSLMEQIQPTLTEHEVMTLARIFADRSQQPMLDMPRVIALVQEQLRKHNYESFNTMDNFMYQDKNKAPSNEKGEIAYAYAEFLKIINWRDCPVPPMQQPVQPDDEWQGTNAKNAVSAISYSALMDAIFGAFHQS